MQGESNDVGSSDADPSAELPLRTDPAAFERALEAMRPELTIYVRQRLGRTLLRRMDPEDVVQQALLEAVRRSDEWRAATTYTLRVWVMLLVSQCLDETRRRNLGAQKRDARRERRIESGSAPDALARRWASEQTGVSHGARWEELRLAMESALAGLEERDRRVLVMRHFDGLSNEEAAGLLGLTAGAASKRYQRALERLRPHLERFTDRTG
ncbi:MAG: sigma-70 family RNA polymerase sigma factor [Planctomycetaceae bacterium]|nr:sigma-70 family RNA polymerase sigma factor [Planctomycetaceae bacterium]